MVRLHTIIAELHRRRVFHMMAYYLVSAWVVLQVADLAPESGGVPGKVLRYVWITAVIGFPIALLFSWRYDIYIHLGEYDRAFELLEQGYRERTWMMRLLKVTPALDPIRFDPRYTVRLDKVGLPPSEGNQR